MRIQETSTAYLVKSHTILNEETNTRIKETNITFENEVAFGLGGYAGFEFPETLLGYQNMIIS